VAGGRAVDLRPAAADDLPAIRAILAAHGNDGAILFGDIVGPYIRHLLAHGRSRVAVEHGEIVGFGATIDTGRAVHLADLFVRPDRLGMGIGRPLLAEVFGDAERRTTFASDDPRALPIYVRAGMRPLWASLYIEGPAKLLPEPPPSISFRPLDAAALNELERQWTGHDRAADWAHWTTQADADNFAVLDGLAVVAIGTARTRQASPVRALSRLVVHPDTGVDPLPPTLAALRRAGGDGPVLAAVQGPSPAVRPLLEAGLRIVDRDQFMASEPDLIDPARLIPNSGML
jgi:GNAT superfamily N-acetyltransferase